jgi:hypothetical protein
MNTPDYAQIAKDLEHLIKGDGSLLDEDREKVARDTSLFYVKPEMVIYPKSAQDISKVLEYVSKKKQEGFDLAVSMRSAGT